MINFTTNGYVFKEKDENGKPTGQYRILHPVVPGLKEKFDSSGLTVTVLGGNKPISAIFLTNKNGEELVAKSDWIGKNVKKGDPIMQLLTQTDITATCDFEVSV